VSELQEQIAERARILAQDDESLLRECERTSFQGSGPGGQKRNRVLSGVRLVHRPTGLRAESSDRRESKRNFDSALQRLRLELALDFFRGDARELTVSREAGLDAARLKELLPDTWQIGRAHV